MTNQNSLAGFESALAPVEPDAKDHIPAVRRFLKKRPRHFEDITEGFVAQAPTSQRSFCRVPEGPVKASAERTESVAVAEEASQTDDVSPGPALDELLTSEAEAVASPVVDVAVPIVVEAPKVIKVAQAGSGETVEDVEADETGDSIDDEPRRRRRRRR